MERGRTPFRKVVLMSIVSYLAKHNNKENTVKDSKLVFKHLVFNSDYLKNILVGLYLSRERRNS